MFQHFNSTDKVSGRDKRDGRAEAGSSASKSELSNHSSHVSGGISGANVNFSIQFPADERENKAHSMNQLALILATIFYALFGAAEAYAGNISKSIALQADSINCFVDAASYLVSYMVEGFKLSNEGVELSYEALFTVEILIPMISTLILVVYMIYFMIEAIIVLVSPAKNPTVDMDVVIWFAVVNIIFNIIVIPMTLYRDDEANGCTCNPKDINLSEELVLTASIEAKGLKSPRNDNAETSLYQSTNLLESDNDSPCEVRRPLLVGSDDESDKYIFSDDGPRVSSGKVSSYSIISDSGENAVHVVRSKVDEKNYNMISAMLHLVGDVIMASGELISALTADFSSVDADICDASAALLTCSLVLSLSIYMLFDLYEAYDRLNQAKLGVVDESLYRKALIDLEHEAE